MTGKVQRAWLAVLLALAIWRPTPALGQSQTIPNLVYDTNPLASDTIPEQKVGDTRAKHTTRADIIATAIQSFTLGLPAQFVCTGSPATTTNGAATISCGWATGLSSHLFFSSSLGGTIGLNPILAADLPVFVASGASHAPGAVPDPGGTAGATRLLREDGTWATPPAGSVSSIICGTGLSGGTITTTGTCALNASAASTIGGVNSLTCGGSNWFSALSTAGAFTCSQPAFSNLGGSATCGQLPAFSGAITTSAGSCASSLASGLTIATPVINSPVINSPTIGTSGSAGSSHLKFAGSVPTFSGSCTGGGTSPAAAGLVGVDSSFVITLHAGTGVPNTSGSCTATFNTAFGTSPACTANLDDSSGSWNSQAPAPHVQPSTSAITVSWSNGTGSPLTAGASYSIDVNCSQNH